MNNFFSGFSPPNQQNFFQQFEHFAQQFKDGVDPRQMVQELLLSGRMSQQQFNQFRAIANSLTGMRI